MSTVEILDMVVRYGGISLFLLIILTYLFSYLKGRLSDDAVRKDIIDVLSEQLKNFHHEVQEQTKVAEAARIRESLAISEVKKWEQVVINLQEDVQELKEQLRKSEESNEELRSYIHEVMKSIQVFAKKRPDAIGDLEIPELQ